MEAIGAVGVLVLGVLALVLVVLAIMMPIFILEIRNNSKEMLVELRTLNTNIGRFLALAQPKALPSLPAPPAPTPKPPPITNLDEAAKFYGVKDTTER